MLFDLQSDNGFRIDAYVVPDTGGTIPAVHVRSDGRDLLHLPANVSIPEFVRAGRHATGMCGFAIDDSLIPGIADYHDLEIYDAATGLLIYRRPPRGMIKDLSIFRLETHLLPLWRLDDAMEPHFQYWYKSIDQQGLETSTQVFCLRNGNSAYVSGRLFIKNYEFYLAKGIMTIGMFRDPYHELAERLILLKNVGARAEAVLGGRDASIYAPVIETLSEYPRLDGQFCKRFFKRAGEAEFIALSDPLVRQLTANSQHELPKSSNVGGALSVLSTFEIIGLRSEGHEFRSALAELAGIDEQRLPVPAEDFPAVIELGEQIRSVHAAEAFIEKDLELFQDLTHAFKTVRP